MGRSQGEELFPLGLDVLEIALPDGAAHVRVLEIEPGKAPDRVGLIVRAEHGNGSIGGQQGGGAPPKSAGGDLLYAGGDGDPLQILALGKGAALDLFHLRRKDEARQPRTPLKILTVDPGHARREGDAGQSLAAPEGAAVRKIALLPEALQFRREGDALQAGAAVEHVRLDFRHTVRNGDAL